MASTPSSASSASYEPCARGISYSRAYASARARSRLATATTSTVAARAPAITTRLMFAVERIPQRVSCIDAPRTLGGDGRAGAEAGALAVDGAAPRVGRPRGQLCLSRDGGHGRARRPARAARRKGALLRRARPRRRAGRVAGGDRPDESVAPP